MKDINPKQKQNLLLKHLPFYREKNLFCTFDITTCLNGRPHRSEHKLSADRKALILKVWVLFVKRLPTM